MRQADFVLAVLPEHSNLRVDNVLFEIGVAIGLKRPIFIIVTPGRELPFSLQSYPYIRANVSDVGAIKFHLEIFLNNLRSGPHHPGKARTQTKSPPGWLATAAGLSSSLSERELEDQISAALTAMGAETVAEPRLEGNLRPDILAWFKGGPPSLGNPVIVEVKARARDDDEVIQQAQRYLAESSARTAIVVLGARNAGIRVAPALGGYVFLISSNEFLDELGRGTLLESLLHARNAFAHGGF